MPKRVGTFPLRCISLSPRSFGAFCARYGARGAGPFGDHARLQVRTGTAALSSRDAGCTAALWLQPGDSFFRAIGACLREAGGHDGGDWAEQACFPHHQYFPALACGSLAGPVRADTAALPDSGAGQAWQFRGGWHQAARQCLSTHGDDVYAHGGAQPLPKTKRAGNPALANTADAAPVSAASIT